MIPTADVLILGGGTIGCAAAYYLSRKSMKVTVLERGDTAFGTAGASGSLITWFSAEPGYRLEFLLESHKLLLGLPEELEGGIGLKANAGNIQVIADEYEMETARISIREHAREGYDAHIVGIREAMEIEPAISPRLLGAIHIPQVHYVDPILLAFAFRRTAERLGARFVNGARVEALLFDGPRVVGARTPLGDFQGGAVVNCCGAWAGQIAAMAGIRLPMTPRRGQMLITEPVAPFVRAEISSCSFQTILFHPELVRDPRVLRYNMSFALEQTDTGTAIIHGTREDVGLDTGNTPEVLELLLRTACRVVPQLERMKIIRAFAGLRPWSDDDLPFIGPLESVPGLYLCCGHGGGGVSMAPMTGKVLAELLAEGEAICFDISPLALSRFPGEQVILNERSAGFGRNNAG